jgi:hypothetical protein
MTTDELNRRFDHHPPTGDKVTRHEAARAIVKNAAEGLSLILAGESREVSLAMTHLEEALFWANAHIARNQS